MLAKIGLVSEMPQEVLYFDSEAVNMVKISKITFYLTAVRIILIGELSKCVKVTVLEYSS